MAKVTGQQAPQQEVSEAIEEILALTVPEIKHAFIQGFLELKVRGIPRHIHFRDPFLAYAILLSESRLSSQPAECGKTTPSTN
jgi:ADP-ribose pyrophosphatase